MEVKKITGKIHIYGDDTMSGMRAIVRLNTTPNIPPTLLEYPDPIQNSVTSVQLSNGNIEFWSYSTNWALTFTDVKTDQEVLPLKIGAFGGNSLIAGVEPTTAKTLLELQTDLETTLDIDHNYARIVAFNTPTNALSWFNANIKPTLDLGKEFLLTLMPNDVTAGSGQGADNLAAINAGIGNTGLVNGNPYNDCLVNLLNVVKTYNKKGLIINFMHEANGQSGTKSWNVWNTGNLIAGQPAITTYVSAYKKFIALADIMGVKPIVKFVQTFTRQNHNNLNVDNANATGTGNNNRISVVNYYVDTIDYIGFNLHNKYSISQESWLSFRSWLNEYYQIFKKFGKEIMICEMGCFPSNAMNKPLAVGTTGHVVNDVLTFSQSGNVNAIPAKIRISAVVSGNPTQYVVTDPGGFFDPTLPIQVTTTGTGTTAGITPKILIGDRTEYFRSAYRNMQKLPLIRYSLLFIQDKIEANIPSRWNFQNASERKNIGKIINQARQAALPAIDKKEVFNLLPESSQTANWTTTNTTIGTNLNGYPMSDSTTDKPSITLSVLGNGGTPQAQAAYIVVDNTKFIQGKNYVLQGLFRFIPTNEANSDDVTVEMTVQQNGGVDPITGSNMFNKFLVHPSIVERDWQLIQQPINFETVTRSQSNQYRMLLQFGHSQIAGRIEVRDFKLFACDELDEIVEIPPVVDISNLATQDESFINSIIYG